MKDITFSIGSIIEYPQKRYRIIFLTKEVIIGCQLDVQYLDLSILSVETVLKDISNKNASIVSDDEMIIDINELSEEKKKDFYIKKQAMQEITDAYGPTYLELCSKNKKPVVDEIVKRGEIKRKTLVRTWIKYLQSGCKDSSLVNRKTREIYLAEDRAFTNKTGMAAVVGKGFSRTEEVNKQFAECLEYYKESNGSKTILQVYEQFLLGKYYKEMIQTTDENGRVILSSRIKPEGERPSYRQLYNYFTLFSKN